MVRIDNAPPKYDGEFLRCVVGSTVFGMDTASSDVDLMGVCIEPPQHVIGLGHFEQHTYRTAPEGVRGGPDDVDCTVYGLRKFMRLAVAQNPTILTLFFVPKEFRTYDGLLADDFRAITELVVSARAAKTFYGYMTTQRERMEGVRGGRHTNRPELVEQFGYDVKYASHAVRLAHQGIEILSTGHLSLPMLEPERSEVQDIRKGKYTQTEVISRLAELETTLRSWESVTALRPEPDVVAVDNFLISMYQEQWSKGY